MSAWVPSTIPVGSAGTVEWVAAEKRNTRPIGVNSPKNITRQHDLRDRPADREGQDHPADVDQTNPLGPSQPQRADRQGEDGQR